MMHRHESLDKSMQLKEKTVRPKGTLKITQTKPYRHEENPIQTWTKSMAV